jgi:hypothetical protein
MADELPEKKDTAFYRWFLIIFSIFIFILCIINAVNYSKILNQYNSQPDVEQDVGRGWARALYGLNITLAILSGIVALYQLWKVISGTKFSLSEKIKSWFSKDEALGNIGIEFGKKGGSADEFRDAVTIIKDSDSLDDTTIRALANITKDNTACTACLKFLLNKYKSIKKNITDDGTSSPVDGAST